ncbi:hypothetical protein O5817_27740, partial [Escherichia coli]|nr:hypothetical protein [Escherichia coli]
ACSEGGSHISAFTLLQHDQKGRQHRSADSNPEMVEKMAARYRPDQTHGKRTSTPARYDTNTSDWRDQITGRLRFR